MNITVRKFDFQNMEHGTIVEILGRRLTGKSTLVRDICLKTKKENFQIYTINPIENEYPFYGKFLTKDNIITEWSPDFIDNFCLKQINSRNHSMLILDSCCYNINEWMTNSNTNRLLTKPYSLHTDVIIVNSYPLRYVDADYVFIFKDNYHNYKDIFNKYGGIFGTFGHFFEIIEAITEQYKCLVIDIRSGEIFWYKVDFKELDALTK